jgi:hypothetical protein
MPKLRKAFMDHVNMVDDFGIANIATHVARNRKERRIIDKYKRQEAKAAANAKSK